jgi:hypothetical protein
LYVFFLYCCLVVGCSRYFRILCLSCPLLLLFLLVKDILFLICSIITISKVVISTISIIIITAQMITINYNYNGSKHTLYRHKIVNSSLSGNYKSGTAAYRYCYCGRHYLHELMESHLFSCRLYPLFPWPSNLMDFQIALFLSLITSLCVHRQVYPPLLGLSFIQPFQTLFIKSFEPFIRPISRLVKFFRYQYNILTIRDDPPN